MPTFRYILPVLAFLFGSCLITPATAQTTITVGHGGGYDYNTIQAAIDAANDGDTVLVHPAVYIENIHFLGKNIVLRSTDPTDTGTVAATVIDGDSSGSVVTFSGSEGTTCVLSGFTIRNGRGSHSSNGGGVYGNGTRATIQKNTITANWVSDYGGGLHNCDGTIESNTISGNSASFYGGGLSYCNGAIQNNTISGNSASSSGGGLCSCSGAILNNTISHNSALHGGGLLDCYGTIEHCIIWQNSADVGPQLCYSSTPTYSCIQHWTGGGEGNISADPLFTTGPLGPYYLSQTVAGQTLQSPCVDVGSSTAAELGLFDRTTRTDGVGDAGFVDMGYHYPATAPPPPTPLITVLPVSISVSVVEGPDATATPTLEVWNRGDGTLVYDVVATPTSWLGVYPYSGQSRGEAVLHNTYLNTFGLSPGAYTGYIVISGNAANSPVMVPVTITVVAAFGPDNLTVSNVDTGPVAPIRLRPGDPIVLSAFFENNGEGPAPPFWTEVWGSRTGGLTLDRFLTDSLWLGGLAGGGTFSWATTAPLYGLPDGPYTVVYAVDRPDEIAETNERDNRAVVAGKRLLVIRPQTNVDVAVEGFGLAPNPAQAGQSLVFSGRVVNRGTAPSGPFWIEFWGSWDWPYPAANFFLCDSIAVANLDPGAALDLAAFSRALYDVPAGIFMAGCIADRDDAINELDETNNYQFVDGQVFNHPWLIRRPSRAPASGADIVVAAADFTPHAPAHSTPGDVMTCSVTIANAGAVDTGPFWLEFWGSRDGGLTLAWFLRDSQPITNLRPGQTATLVSQAPLYSIPDGPYSLTVFADRPGDVAESNERNNRLTVAQKRLLTIRHQTQTNLVIDDFSLRGGAWGEKRMYGFVRNLGSGDSGPFWIEFWAAPGDPDYPAPHNYAADSILVHNLAAGEIVDLLLYDRVPYDWLFQSRNAIICVVDGLDQVAETDETDNYAMVRGFPQPR